MKQRIIRVLTVINLCLAAAALVLGVAVYWQTSELSDDVGYDLYDMMSYDYIVDTGKAGLMVTNYRSYGGDLRIREGATAIGVGVFNGVQLLNQDNPQIIKSVYLPDSLRVIESRAFFATQAEWVRLPDDIMYIGDLAFAESTSLKRVYFDKVPDHHIEIAPSAFAYLEGVEFVNFPDYIVFGEDNFISYK